MDIKEIESAMHTLACGDTNYEAVSRLASLIIVRDHLLSEHMPRPLDYSGNPRTSISVGGKSEFLTAVSEAPLEDVMEILDEHMEALKAVIPREYDAVLARIKRVNL